MKIEELNIEVDDLEDFNYQASELLTEFCEDLEAKGMTRPVEEDEKWIAEEEGFSFYWKSEAAKLIEAGLNRLHSIAVKYFGRDNKYIDISSHMYKTP